jgi:glycosyltransferase involved in cell wall biosynthesis
MLRVAYDVTVSVRAETGVGVYARELMAALRTRSLRLHEWRHPLAPAGHRIGRLENGIRLAAWYGSEAARRADREDISVYHSTTSLGPFRVRRPVVITVHDATAVTMPFHRGFADRRFQQVFGVAAARRADALLAPSAAAADAVSDIYGVPRSRIRVTPLGVAAAFRDIAAGDVQAILSRHNLTFPYVLFVGAEAPRKNLRRLIEAFAALGPCYRDVRLVFAGPHALRDPSLDPLARRLGVATRFRRLAGPTRDELPAIYAGASCVAMVSLCEGFGLPIAEGMAAGAPVVASNCSSMPEVAGDAAILVDPLSVDAIANGLSSVIGDSALAEDLRRRGRARSPLFDWSITGMLTEQVYRDVASR